MFVCALKYYIHFCKLKSSESFKQTNITFIFIIMIITLINTLISIIINYFFHGYH